MVDINKILQSGKCIFCLLFPGCVSVFVDTEEICENRRKKKDFTVNSDFVQRTICISS